MWDWFVEKGGAVVGYFANRRVARRRIADYLTAACQYAAKVRMRMPRDGTSGRPLDDGMRFAEDRPILELQEWHVRKVESWLAPARTQALERALDACQALAKKLNQRADEGASMFGDTLEMGRRMTNPRDGRVQWRTEAMAAEQRVRDACAGISEAGDLGWLSSPDPVYLHRFRSR